MPTCFSLTIINRSISHFNKASHGKQQQKGMPLEKYALLFSLCGTDVNITEKGLIFSYSQLIRDNNFFTQIELSF